MSGGPVAKSFRNVISSPTECAIDEEYVRKANDPPAVVGRKIALDASEIVVLIEIVERVEKRLFDGAMSARKPSPSQNLAP